MLEGVNIVCFAASYAVALALEISRIFFRSGLRGALRLGFAFAGLLAQALYLVNRALDAQAAPLSSPFDWYLVAAWVVAAVYLYLSLAHPKAAIGLFVLPLVLVLVGVAVLWADRQPFPRTQASQIWGMIHGGFLLLGTVAVTVGFAAGMMYLVQARRLKRKQLAAQGLELPSLEWLARTNARAIIVSALMLGLGLASGSVLNVINHRLDNEAVPWTDPVVISSGGLFAWMLAAAIFAVAYKPARLGRKVAYLTVASFAFLVLSLAVTLFSPSQHRRAVSRAQPEGARRLAWRPSALHSLPPRFTPLRPAAGDRRGGP